MKRHLSSITLLSLALGSVAVVQASSASAAARPNGAVPVTPTDVTKSGAATCAPVNGKFVAGTRLKGNYFVSHVQQAANFKSAATNAKGAAKTKATATSKSWAAKAKAQQKLCDALNSGNSTAGGSTGNTGGSTGNAKGKLKFNIKNAVGIALVKKATVKKKSTPPPAGGIDEVAPEDTTLVAVDEAGKTTEAISSGEAVVKKFLVAPNDKLYVLFASPTTVGDATTCLLAEVDPATGDPKCIENELTTVAWNSGEPGSLNPSIQFDAAGAIYYVGTAQSGKYNLRKYAAGATTSLINDNIQIYDFLVLSDGNVYYTGMTLTTKLTFTRRIDPAGGLSVVQGDRSWFLMRFADNNVYYGIASKGVLTWLTKSNKNDDFPYIAPSTATQIARNDTTKFCVAGVTANDGFCEIVTGTVTTPGVYIRQSFNTMSGKTFVNAGNAPMGTLMQYYPQVKRATTVVDKMTIGQVIVDYIIMAGVNANGQNVLTIYDTTSGTERKLIDETKEIEIYRLNYVSSNKIMFDGLRFSDNKYVIGQVDLSTGAVVASQTGSDKLVDFQTFAS
ncbi:MAG: hypothetical protein ACKOYL_02935 [Actinomycetota bacterium]